MEFLVFFIGCILVLAALVLASEVRKLSAASKAEREGANRSFASFELAMDQMVEEMEAKGREILAQIEAKEADLRKLIAEVAVCSEASSSAHEEPDLVPQAATVPHTHFDRVKALHGEGMSVVEIARRLGIGQGEVQLILDLAKSRR